MACSNVKLCPDKNLIWANEFRLLGVDFDATLTQMGRNFSRIIGDIEKIFKKLVIS